MTTRQGIEGYEFVGSYAMLVEDINVYYRREGDVHRFKFTYKFIDELGPVEYIDIPDESKDKGILNFKLT